ncbi:MAG: UDP-N-acetylmuramoyl-tripeptide--D-alanyl-D-alanine ligase, partial [Deltaproteobacteria bacterium]|nr:UDP-N-acetylmuramoyl-tripeptide--D-alanyl-D-alanine ligase [Deltaproteobacteria bacterium]
SRSVSPGSLFIPLKGPNFDGHDYIEDAFRQGARAALVQQGSTAAQTRPRSDKGHQLIAVTDCLHALGDLAGYWRSRFSAKVVAVTGSNGKTTTKELAWNIIRPKMPVLKNPGNWNNLIGLPLSLLQLDDTHQAVLLELGMNETGEIRRLAKICTPDIGIITNIGPAHLEKLGSIEGVAAAKAELFEELNTDALALINND